MNGTNSADLIEAKKGNDWVYGRAGSDEIWAGEGDDYVEGGSGSDKIYGGTGHHKLYGGTSNDTVVGENGDDTIVGSPGDDDLYGGNTNYASDGSDTFRFVGNTGSDTIHDFDPNEDFIDSSALGYENVDQMEIQQEGDHVLITLHDGSEITLNDVNIDDINDGMFIL
ncbi:hypothetical protein [uncultured Ruegeria sp.]|uniref:calcium-binding protein n=1 Tax=uncultured Ruegeria sp. TaxID=259304 RepID=UPI00344C2DCE